MDKLSKALNQQNQPLSNADFKKRADSNYWKPVIEFQTQLNKDLVERKKRFKEEMEQERQQDLRRVRQDYEWKLTKATNLSIAYAILLEKNPKLDLIPNLENKAFIETVQDNFYYVELEILADRLYKLSEDLNEEIDNIKSFKDPDLYYQYHTYDKGYRTTGYGSNRKPIVENGGDVPTLELIEMENEQKIYNDLYHEIEKLINYNPDYKDSIKRVKQALALK